MARKPDKNLPTTLYSTALADYSAGMHMVQGILLALLQRDKTGVGQSLSVSLYDSMLAMQMQEASMWLSRKRDLNWGAFPLTGVFQTTDGARDRRRLQANPLGYLPRSACPTCRPIQELATFTGRPRTRPSCTRLFRGKISTGTTAHCWQARRAGPVVRAGADRRAGAPIGQGASKMVVTLNGSSATAAQAAWLADHRIPRLQAASRAAGAGRARQRNPGRAGL
jgi:formyl-CoA transferase